MPDGVSARALVEPGRAYAIYIRPIPDEKEWKPIESLVVELPRGKFKAEWILVVDGSVARRELFDHDGGDKPLAAPVYRDDVALRITREE